METIVAAADLADTLHSPKRADETSAAQAATPAASVGAEAGAKAKGVAAVGDLEVSRRLKCEKAKRRTGRHEDGHRDGADRD